MNIIADSDLKAVSGGGRRENGGLIPTELALLIKAGDIARSDLKGLTFDELKELNGIVKQL